MCAGNFTTSPSNGFAAQPGCRCTTDRVSWKSGWAAHKVFCRYDVDPHCYGAIFGDGRSARGLLFLSNMQRICSRIASDLRREGPSPQLATALQP